MTNEAFEQIVNETVQELPEEFRSHLDNVEIVIEPYPTDEQGKPLNTLLGLYHGVPKPQRTNGFILPDKITIYKEVILSVSTDPTIIKQTIKDTVLHEIGHYFGLSDEDLKRVQHH